MNFFVKLLLTAGLVMVFAGCGEEDADPTGSDGGDDTSADGGTGDTGTGNGGDITPCTNCVAADANGWIDGTTNPWGIQGSWFTYSDADTAAAGLTPSDITAHVSPTGGYCASGTAKAADPPNWTVWGAGVGFNLCIDNDDVEHTVESCPTDLNSIIGIRVTITGTIGDFRVTMAEADRDEGVYITADEADNGTPVDYLFENATVEYRPSDPPLDKSLLRAIQFQVSSSQSADTPFDFCIDNVEMITQ